jgi:hypothetical protein
MDGTQIPMNMAAFSSPLKYKISEKTSERKDARNSNLSVIENFLSMLLDLFGSNIVLKYSNT